MLKPSQPAQIGSLEIFWPLIEPILTALGPRRVCEIGVASGALTGRLLAWMDGRDCAYIGIDPAPERSVTERFAAMSDTAGHRFLRQPSLVALPGLGRCDVYFIDGDHNYFTVRNELEGIAEAARNNDTQSPAPVIFMHDVGWPWGRRDMYYLPTTVPPDARQPWSETLGVTLDREELIEGGLREPGRYAVALRSGGPRNGVLTAVEDFLRSDDGAGWQSIVLPVAYGFAVLHRAPDATLPAACLERLEDLRKMAATGGAFLQACEQNFLRTYLYGEYQWHAAYTAVASHDVTLKVYAELERSYQELLAHSHSLEGEYQKLLTAYRQLREHAAASAGSPQTARPEDQFE